MKEIRCDGCGTHLPANSPKIQEIALHVPVRRIAGELESDFRARGIHSADLCEHCVEEVLRGYFAQAIPLQVPAWIEGETPTPRSLRVADER